MALTLGSLLGSVAVIFGLLLAVVWLNLRWRNSGWWLLLAFMALVIAGNA